MSIQTALEPCALPADAVEIARISGAWGIKGWFKIDPHSASAEALFSSKRWYVLPADRLAKKSSSQNSPTPAARAAAAALSLALQSGCALLRVQQSKEHGSGIVAQAHEIDSREDAEQLQGLRIFIPRSSFPSTQNDEYYWVDLIGLRILNRQDQVLGSVIDLLSTGPQTVLVIEYLDADSKTQTFMIPFVNQYIDRVALADKVIHVDWLTDY